LFNFFFSVVAETATAPRFIDDLVDEHAGNRSTVLAAAIGRDLRAEHQGRESRAAREPQVVYRG
jgi:hypothetical protein